MYENQIKTEIKPPESLSTKSAEASQILPYFFFHLLVRRTDIHVFTPQSQVMPFVRALYFPYLDDSFRQSPPPRLVRLEVVLESRTWHASVEKLFSSSEVENFIIDGPCSEFVDCYKPCSFCGEKQSNCSCSPLSDVPDNVWGDQLTQESPETSYMMTFAAVSTSDCDGEEPLLDRDCDSESEKDCWTRDFLFFKLNGGFPIDIGSSVPGHGNSGSTYATMMGDIVHLQKFFAKLVRDKNLVERRFTPGFQAELNFGHKQTHFLRSIHDDIERHIESMRLESVKTPTKPKVYGPPVRRTQSAGRKPHLLRQPLSSTRKFRSNFPAVQSIRRPIHTPRLIITPLRAAQWRLRISKKYKSAPNTKATVAQDAGFA
ncbi:hypothetical protein L211DRAFT_835886 [Terfezia boudieri ATCC MYA-4762]|uniref:Uncharacterized protein n=1 Tax=Terfezia boudieri ATCC MYA-4762 TaxID=1051890 RepID=A0A3N4LSH1_9PEZI|nr:hypothetical protein L211DRAFT_835886 [Terfezia boudieri ATCC MYA-4762]